MTQVLARGGNTALQDTQGRPVQSLLLGMNWANPGVDVIVCAILATDERKVRSDSDFLYWDNPIGPNEEAFLLTTPVGAPSPVADRAQVVVSIGDIPAEVTHIFISLATLDEGMTMARAGALDARVISLSDGGVIAYYSNPAGYDRESCVVVWEVYRYKGAWKVRAIDQGWLGGLADLGREYGVDIE